jgi:hypothetical protein
MKKNLAQFFEGMKCCQNLFGQISQLFIEKAMPIMNILKISPLSSVARNSTEEVHFCDFEYLTLK